MTLLYRICTKDLTLSLIFIAALFVRAKVFTISPIKYANGGIIIFDFGLY
ncbi:MAG: hypothetical protein LBI78_00925 [Campylobacteraceae bacterium]|nr:hypothetical protein [Campylobacteraceae bacterium]